MSHRDLDGLSKEEIEFLILEIETEIDLERATLNRHKLFKKKMIIEHKGELDKRKGYRDRLQTNLDGFIKSNREAEEHRRKPIKKAENDIQELIKEQGEALKLKEESIKSLSSSLSRLERKLKKLRGN